MPKDEERMEQKKYLNNGCRDFKTTKAYISEAQRTLSEINSKMKQTKTYHIINMMILQKTKERIS